MSQHALLMINCYKILHTTKCSEKKRRKNIKELIFHSLFPSLGTYLRIMTKCNQSDWSLGWIKHSWWQGNLLPANLEKYLSWVCKYNYLAWILAQGHAHWWCLPKWNKKTIFTKWSAAKPNYTSRSYAVLWVQSIMGIKLQFRMKL